MKSRILFATALLALSVASCKKAYTCTCTVVTTVNSSSGSGTLSTQTTETPYSEKMSESQAKAACTHEQESIESIEDNAITGNNVQPGNGSAAATCNIH